MLGSVNEAAIDDVYLADMRDIVNSEERADLELGARFFPRFARGALLGRLAVLQEPGGQPPISFARRDRALSP